MVKIKEVSSKIIKDSRGEETIEVSVKTDGGTFSASAPQGKSTGKYEAKQYKKNIKEDMKNLKKFSEYFSEEVLEKYEHLKQIEDIVRDYIGANTMIALEYAILKSIAKEQKKEVWELINPNAKKIPRFLGNLVEGGKHSLAEKKPDFQEFLISPNLRSAKENFETMKKNKQFVEELIKKEDKSFRNRKTDEDAWMTALNEKQIFEILEKLKVPFGTDVAASSFYSRKKYRYLNPLLTRDSDEQLFYTKNLIKNFNLFYVEDKFDEEDFESFAKLSKISEKTLIVGDDLTVTNLKRLEKAIKMKAINGIIIKPNQIGSLIEVKEVVELAKKNDIKIIFSHRSGETDEEILADLAFGFQADFLKCGITGAERETKIKRIIEIEKSLK